MTTIFYETFPIAWATFESEWRLGCDASWEARRSALPTSLTIPFRLNTGKDHHKIMGYALMAVGSGAS